MAGILTFAFRQAEAFLRDGLFLVGGVIGRAEGGDEAGGEGEGQQANHEVGDDAGMAHGIKPRMALEVARVALCPGWIIKNP